MKRHITLYYASISLRNISLSLLWWLISCWRKPALSRSILTDLIGQKYHPGSWFTFGSARSGLAAFLNASGIGQGDEVILSSYTCLAVPTAIVAVGATPVYIDINPESLNIDEQSIWPAITVKTRAIIVQHTLGNPFQIENILCKLRAKGLLVIEDCALSLGSKLANRYVGTQGDASIFSMELSKTLSCGWGGLLLVNNLKLVSAMNLAYSNIPEQSIFRSTRDVFQTVVSTWSNHPSLLEFPGKYILWLCSRIGLFRQSTPASEFDGVVASNFIEKMGGAQTILAIQQWQDFHLIANSCANNHIFFSALLKSLGYTVHAELNGSAVMVTNRVSFLVNSRQQIIEYFRKERIYLGEWFDGPLSPIPTATIFNYQRGVFLRAEHIARHVVNIPSHSRLSANDRNRIAQVLHNYTKTHPGAPFV
jgi:perosamine synthetase